MSVLRMCMHVLHAAYLVGTPEPEGAEEGAAECAEPREVGPEPPQDVQRVGPGQATRAVRDEARVGPAGHVPLIEPLESSHAHHPW